MPISSAAMKCCCLMVTLLAMRIPRTSSTELLSSWLPTASTGAQGYSPPGSGLCISLAQLHNVPAGPLFQPPKVPVHDGPDLELINCSPDLVPRVTSLMRQSVLLSGHAPESKPNNLSDNHWSPPFDSGNLANFPPILCPSHDRAGSLHH